MSNFYLCYKNMYENKYNFKKNTLIKKDENVTKLFSINKFLIFYLNCN